VIWLLRHGDAEPHGGDDASRELTDKGRKQAHWAGAALAAIGAEIEMCMTSPKVRAEQTARIACGELGMEPEIEESLRGGIFDPLELAAGRGEVLLVGHEPDFSSVIAHLTGARIRMRKGGLAGVEQSTLHALYRPKDLRAMAGI
jgi:phosphohistidine phosphatase